MSSLARPHARSFALAALLVLAACESEDRMSVDPACLRCSPVAACVATMGGRECVCPSGYEGDGITCTKADPCAIDNGGCDPNAMCLAGVTGVACRCRDGWLGTGKLCYVVEAGAAGTGRCHQPGASCDPNSSCLDAPDVTGFMCACADGFSGDGARCTAGGACADGGGCDRATSFCVVESGDTRCACRPGFVEKDGGCAPRENCFTDENCHADATCEGEPGERRCVCRAGIAGNGKWCGDLCTADGDCGDDAECVGEAGAKACVCAGGFAGNGWVCTWGGGACSGPSQCPKDATCGPNGRCLCNAGLVGTPPDCVPDPCLTDNGGCGLNANCSGATGTAVCTCRAPFVESSSASNVCVRCNVDADCTGGETCADGGTTRARCRPPPSPCDTANGGCGDNETCTWDGVTAGCECRAPFRDDGGECVRCTAATAEADCGANSACVGTGAGATCACAAPYRLVNDACVRCSVDADCGAGGRCTNAGTALAACGCAAGYYSNGGSCVPRPFKLLASGRVNIELSYTVGGCGGAWNHGFEYVLELTRSLARDDTYEATMTQGPMTIASRVTVLDFATGAAEIDQTATYDINYVKSGNTVCPAGTGRYTFASQSFAGGRSMPSSAVRFTAFGLTKPLWYSESANVSGGQHTYAGSLAIDRACNTTAECPGGTTCKQKQGSGLATTYCLP